MTTGAKAERSDGPLDVTVEIEAGEWPPHAELAALVRRAAAETFAAIGAAPAHRPELSVVFTDDARIAALNSRWRGKEDPTNVLSFPLVELQPGATVPPLLGDIVIACETVEREAGEQGKPFIDHLTHLIVHGLLHLVGHDHMREDEAAAMEALERRILERLAIPDPYA